MIRRLKITVITVIAVLAGISAAVAAPVWLSSIKVDGKLDLTHPPSVIAQDSQGKLYVISVLPNNVIRIFDNNGIYQKSLNFDENTRPTAIAVDAAGLIYVCLEKQDDGRFKDGKIAVYNPDLSFSKYLGEAQGPVQANKIAIDKEGKIYIVDRLRLGAVNHGMVWVYDSDGNLLTSFGSYGNGNGMLNGPLGIAINEALGEIYINDMALQTVGGTPGTSAPRIQVFNKSDGSYKRTLPIQLGSRTVTGDLVAPRGMAIDKSGSLYVADIANNVVVFDPQNGTVLTAKNIFGLPLKQPKDIIIGNDDVAHVVSSGSIESYALDGYTTLTANPTALFFTATQFSGNPASQNISITTTGTGTVTWSSSDNQAWITTSDDQLTATVTVAVNIASLGTGTHSGAVIITSDAGQSTIPVTLTINSAPGLFLNNGSVTFSANPGVNPAPKIVGFVSQSSPIRWTATSDSLWTSITPTGDTTSAAVVSIDMTKLPLVSAPSYTATITFRTDPIGQFGDSSTLMVSLNILSASRVVVTVNKPNATFTLAGPNINNRGTGSLILENAEAGSYTVTFDTLPGYKRPFPQVKMLAANNEISFTGKYVSWKDLAAKKNIVSARGPWVNNDARVKSFRADGTAINPDLMAMDSGYGATVAVGDVNGDGSGEIIVGSGAGPENTTQVRIFKADKTTILADFIAFPGMKGGVHVAVGDFDADGRDEIIVAPAGGAENAGIVKIYAYNDDGSMTDSGLTILAHSSLSGVNIAVADVDGNFSPRLITAPVSGMENDPGYVKIWKVDTSKGMSKWSAPFTPLEEITLQGRHGAAVASGDVDGDGKDEIIIASVASDTLSGESNGSVDDKSQIIVYKADGTELKRFTVVEDRHGVNICAADLDGDGIAEIIAGVGADPGIREAASSSDDREERKNKKGRITRQKTEREDNHDDRFSGIIRVYNAAGVLQYSVTPYENAKYGVNVAVGDLGL